MPARLIGEAGGAMLEVSDVLQVSVAALKSRHEGWFPAYMAGELPSLQAAE